MTNELNIKLKMFYLNIQFSNSKKSPVYHHEYHILSKKIILINF